MIYFNNIASTFNITILINLSPKRPAPTSHVTAVLGWMVKDVCIHLSDYIYYIILSFSLFFSLFLSACFSVSLSVNQSICLSVLHVRLAIRFYVCLSVCPLSILKLDRCLLFYLSVCLCL